MLAEFDPPQYPVKALAALHTVSCSDRSDLSNLTRGDGELALGILKRTTYEKQLSSLLSSAILNHFVRYSIFST